MDYFYPINYFESQKGRRHYTVAFLSEIIS